MQFCWLFQEKDAIDQLIMLQSDLTLVMPVLHVPYEISVSR